MYIAIIALSVTVIVLGYALYNAREDAAKLRGAIQEHFNIKNAPYGLPDVNIDYVDQELWLDTGIK